MVTRAALHAASVVDGDRGQKPYGRLDDFEDERSDISVWSTSSQNSIRAKSGGEAAVRDDQLF